MQEKNLAAIDLGSNSCRIYITDNEGKVLYREAESVKLGEKLCQDKNLSDDAMKRGLACLYHYAELLKSFNVEHYRAIATASCRMASNSEAFVKMVEELCNIKLDIISAYDEAYLNLCGAKLNADKQPYILVYDLGGGSTEITLATNEAKPKIIYTLSIPYGARNAAEAFDIIEYDEEKCQRLHAEIKKYTQEFLTNSEFLIYKPKCCCLATSSTPLRLFNMLEKTPVYDMNYADGLTKNTADLSNLMENIWKMDFTQMKNSVYIGTNRAPIFVAACVIFKTIYEELQITKLTASLKSAQEAIIEELKR